MFALISILMTLGGTTWALYPSTSSVIELTPFNFDKMLQTDEVWIVEFFAPWCGHCQALVPEYTKAAAALKGVVKLGAVNADEHKDLAVRYGVKGFPTIKIFGANKNKPEDYSGARTAQGLMEAGLKAAKDKVKAKLGEGSFSSGSDVIELTDRNFDKMVLESREMWLVEFFAPWCGHCKNLAPHWAQAATELKGKVKVGALDATVHQVQASKYGVKGYPTIKYFAPGSSRPVSDYDGGRTAGDIVNWALEKWAENLPAPELEQLLSPSIFKENCIEKPLCVLTFLPNILDCQSQCRNNYLKIIKEVSEKYKMKMWGWVWSEAMIQLDLENTFDIGGSGYPDMVVFSAKKMKYSTFKGSFSKEGLTEFLRDLAYGRSTTSPVTRIPMISTIHPWDGKDGEPIHEIHLSEADLRNEL